MRWSAQGIPFTVLLQKSGLIEAELFILVKLRVTSAFSSLGQAHDTHFNVEVLYLWPFLKTNYASALSASLPI